MTPLSIELRASDAPAEFVFRKDGHRDKTLSLIPNVSSPVFAALQAEAPRPSPPRAHAARVRRPSRHARVDDTDDVLAPTFR
jgi:hypothetical protein